MRALRIVVAVVGVMVGSATSVVAQRPDSTPTKPPPGAFVGFITRHGEKAPVQSADIRLYWIDSARVVKDAAGVPTIDASVDTSRSRLALSNADGYFAVWRLAAGRYLLNARRIGFEPIEAVVTVDTETVLFDFTMTPLSPLLAKVEIKESASNPMTRRLDRVGFSSRVHFGEGQFVTSAELMKRKPQTIREILGTYGITSNAQFILDRMPLDYDDIQEYPADLVAGIEIYRHGRPIEYSGTRRGPTILSPGGGAFLSQVLVVIWTYIPGV